jgi:hypothetical protein
MMTTIIGVDKKVEDDSTIVEVVEDELDASHVIK